MPKIPEPTLGDLIEETCKTAMVAREAARDLDDLLHPFDWKAHSAKVATSTRG